MVGGLIDDADPRLRSHGVAAIHLFRLADFRPRLSTLQQVETDPWVQYEIERCLSEDLTQTWEDFAAAAMDGYTDEPPF
ncbi:hypothetical protein BJF79_17685 [Actinomadura sp. CNU-125]|nr:hypothetical protein BJF79_17685 [Actinomadura sp. CNU-125]